MAKGMRLDQNFNAGQGHISQRLVKAVEQEFPEVRVMNTERNGNPFHYFLGPNEGEPFDTRRSREVAAFVKQHASKRELALLGEERAERGGRHTLLEEIRHLAGIQKCEEDVGRLPKVQEAAKMPALEKAREELKRWIAQTKADIDSLSNSRDPDDDFHVAELEGALDEAESLFASGSLPEIRKFFKDRMTSRRPSRRRGPITHDDWFATQFPRRPGP